MYGNAKGCEQEKGCNDNKTKHLRQGQSLYKGFILHVAFMYLFIRYQNYISNKRGIKGGVK
jgi:hypothetical protein